MKGKIRLVLCGVLLLSMLLWTTPALALPPIPHAFYGAVLINGSNAPAGTVVSARINGTNAGSYTTKNSGLYGSVAQRDYLAVSCDGADDGDTITFYVGSTLTAQTAAFSVGGGPTQLDLNVGTAGGGGGGAPAPPITVTADVFGGTDSFAISAEGIIQETFTATSPDGTLTMTIPAGTIALDAGGNPLGSLAADIDESLPDPPEGAHVIGLAFNFGPEGATFDPGITLEFTYDPAELPEGVAEADLVIAYYDATAGEWVTCDCTCDPEANSITACICHFTTFAIIGTPRPANLSISSLLVSPTEVHPNEPVTITLSVSNSGGTAGSYTAVLEINGVKEAEKVVTVAAGSSQLVSFSVSKEETGSYSITIEGLSGSFTVVAPAPMSTPTPPPATPTPPAPTSPATETMAPVTPPPSPEPGTNWAMIGGIIAAAAVVVVLGFVFLVKRRD